MYATLDRPRTKQYREFWGPADAVQAAREGKPIPHVHRDHAAERLDAERHPGDAEPGRFVKDKLMAVNAMKKDRGLGHFPRRSAMATRSHQSFSPDAGEREGHLTARSHLPPAVLEGRLPHQPRRTAGRFRMSATVAARTGATDVSIANFAFGAGTIKVRAGEIITWTNATNTRRTRSPWSAARRSAAT